MQQKGKRMAIAAIFLGAILCGQSNAQSSGGPYVIERVVIAGGGSPIAGSDYQVTSTLGQAATATLSGAQYTLFGGFWSPVGSLVVGSMFADGFE